MLRIIMRNFRNSNIYCMQGFKLHLNLSNKGNRVVTMSNFTEIRKQIKHLM